MLNLDSITFLSNFLEKNSQSAASQSYKKLETLSETVQKINDLKKAYVGKIPRTESSETWIEWSLLLDSINIEYCNTVSVSSHTH